MDKLCGKFIEPLCIQPSFITDHPTVMSPLAKRSKSNSAITDRFELFVGGRELANAYTELNNPDEQAERFKAQEAVANVDEGGGFGIDEDFVGALQYGLPPTAGWGMGIDRLAMLLTGKKQIKDVILFPR